MKSVFVYLLFLSLAFVQACYCLSGPNVTWYCAASSNSTRIFKDGALRPVWYNPVYDFSQIGDSLYLDFFNRWSEQEYFELYFSKTSSGTFKFDSLQSRYTVSDGVNSNHYEFKKIEWVQEEYLPNECCADPRGNCLAKDSLTPKSFKGILNAQVLAGSEVFFLEFRLDISSQLHKDEEC